MTERRAVVRVLPLGDEHEVAGVVAELVALLATTTISVRTLYLLRTLAVHDRAIAGVPRLRLEVDLTHAQSRVYRRLLLERCPLGGEEDTSDVA